MINNGAKHQKASFLKSDKQLEFIVSEIKKRKKRLFVINTDVPFTYRFTRHEILAKISRSLNLKVDNHLCSKLKTNKFLISCGNSVNHIIEIFLFYLYFCTLLLI